MGLAPHQTEAFVSSIAGEDARLSFGELATSLYLHSRPALRAGSLAPAQRDEAVRSLAQHTPGGVLDCRSFLSSLFPAGQRLDGAPLSDAQLASYERFLDADGDGAVTAPDLAAWLLACTGMQSQLLSARQPAAAAAAAEASDEKAKPAYANGMLTQFNLLIRREFVMFLSDKQNLQTAFAGAIVIPLFLGGMYWRIEQRQQNFTNLVAALFLTCLFSGVLPLNTTMMTFPSEQVNVRREYGNGCYHALAYYLSKVTFLSITRGGQSVIISGARSCVVLSAVLRCDPRRLLTMQLPWHSAGVRHGGRVPAAVHHRKPVDFCRCSGCHCCLELHCRPYVRYDPCCCVCLCALRASDACCAGILVPDAQSAATVSMPFVLIQILFSGAHSDSTHARASHSVTALTRAHPTRLLPDQERNSGLLPLGVRHQLFPLFARDCDQEHVSRPALQALP